MFLVRVSLLMLGLGSLFNLLFPCFRRCHVNPASRRCFAVQKTILGAIEMHNLDNNTSLEELTPGALTMLVDRGYLQSFPEDPGQGLGAAANYRLTGHGDIVCLRHGFIMPPTGDPSTPARDQLVAGGTTNAELASLASVLQPDSAYTPRGARIAAAVDTAGPWGITGALILAAFVPWGRRPGSSVHAKALGALAGRSPRSSRGRSRTASTAAFAAADGSEELRPGIVFVGPSHESMAQASCPVCGGALDAVEAVRCDACDALHHRDCWEYLGGCATYACACRRSRGLEERRTLRAS